MEGCDSLSRPPAPPGRPPFGHGLRKATECFRKPGHDYRAPFIYLITLSRLRGRPDFSTIEGHDWGSRQWARTLLSPLGNIFNNCLHRWLELHPDIKLMASSIMPDHVHLLLRVLRYMEKPLGCYIGELKGSVTAECTRAFGHSDLWQPNFHDRLCLHDGQRQVMYEYVKQNPFRRWTVMTHPDWFVRVHERMLYGKRISLYGNPFLLDNPEIAAVRISRRCTDAEVMEQWHREYEPIALNGGVLVSPFISPGEKRVKELALHLQANIIQIRPNGFRELEKPQGEWFAHCSEGHLLIVAPAVRKVPEPPHTKALFENMNLMARRIAGYGFIN